MPMFSFEQDPGASFGELLKRVGLSPFGESGPASEMLVPHATTCVALRCANGVVMAGDRRATSGNLISHREMEKVVQADQFSGVAIAGAAGPAMEMVKLFQLQIEHYEKVEGQSLSLKVRQTNFQCSFAAIFQQRCKVLWLFRFSQDMTRF